MADFSIADLDATQASTSPIADTLQAIANLGRDAACGFFHAYAAIVLPNPTADFPDALWDGLCKNSTAGLPPAPTPPFPSGQCKNKSYTVTYSFDIVNPSTGALIRTISNAKIVQGDITAIYLTNPPDGFYGLIINHLNQSSGQYSNTTDTYGGTGFAQNLDIISVTLVGGGTDCGSLPPHYPNPPIPPIPTTPGGTTYNLGLTSITYNNGNTYNLIPTLNLSVPFSPVIQIGGVNIAFTGGGATVTPIGQGSDSTLLNEILSNLGDGTLAGGGVGAIVAGIAKNTAPTPIPGSPGTQIGTLMPPTTHTQKGIANLSSVTITLTTLPSSRNEIFASDANYNIYIAGWFQWLQGSLPIGTRMPIQTQASIWFCPKGGDGYTYTLTNGAVGTSQATTTTS